jgi:hypothetical protein
MGTPYAGHSSQDLLEALKRAGRHPAPASRSPNEQKSRNRLPAPPSYV